MRLTAVNCIFLACTAAALATETRPKRHLQQIKEIITSKLFGSDEPTPPPTPETKYFRIPGFDHVMVKAVPKGINVEAVPVYEKVPLNSQIGVIGSFLGTSTLNETVGALQGVKNLLQSGILGAKHDAVLQELAPIISRPPIVEVIAQGGPVKPCLSPEFEYHGIPIPAAIPLPQPKPIRVVAKPPRVPIISTPYSYKQVNQDGSVTTYTGTLGFNNRVTVTDGRKTLPFFIDRMRKIPVKLPVPVLPAMSDIIVTDAFDASLGGFPVEVIHPGPNYSYKQLHKDGRLTTYTGFPPMFGKHGDVIVTETGRPIPPPPFYIVDRIGKVALSAVYSRPPFIEVRGPPPYPAAIDVPVGPVVFNTPAVEPQTVKPIPEISALDMSSSSYGQINSGPQTSSYSGGAAQEQFGGNFGEAPTLSNRSPDLNSYSYKQIGEDGKVTTYTGSSVFEEYGGELPPPPVAVPTGYVKVPSIHARVPLRPVKVPMPPININRRVFEAPVYSNPFGFNGNPNAMKPSMPFSGTYSYKQVNSNGETSKYGPVHVQHHELVPNTPPVFQPIPPPPIIANIPIEKGCAEPVFEGPVPGVPLQYSYKQISHSNPDKMVVVNVEDPVRDLRKVNQQMGGYQQPQQHVNTLPSHNTERIPGGYVYIPPTDVPSLPQLKKETSPSPSFSYKHISSQGVYEYTDTNGVTDQTKTNQAPSTPSQVSPTVPVRINPTVASPAISTPKINRNSFANNPIVVPEQGSFSYQQNNADGTSVKVENEGNDVTVKVNDTPKRFRKVKHRGDIPDAE